MPNLNNPSIAEWQEMTPARIKEHISRGVMPPIMGADDGGEGGNGGEGGEGDPPKPKEPEPKQPTQADVDALKESLRKEREIRANAEKKITELEPKAKAHDDLTEAQKDELQKAKDALEDSNKTNSTLQQQIRDANLKVALADAKHGVASPSLAALALKAQGIEFDENNQPKDLDAAVKAAIEAEPALAGTPSKKGAPNTNGGDGSGDGNNTPNLTAEELEAAKASDMTPEEYVAYRDSTEPPEDKSGT